MKHPLITACIGALAATAAFAASTDERFNLWPTYDGDDLELRVDASGTHFTLWSPEAQAAQVLLYPTDRNSAPDDTITMTRGDRPRPSAPTDSAPPS